PGIEVKTSQMPKLFAGQFGAEISTLLSSNAEFVHSSLWGGDLEAFVLQAAPRDLFKKSAVILTTGEPVMYMLPYETRDGTIIGARALHGLLAPQSDLNKWYRAEYQGRYQLPPVYPSYHMAQAILGTKAAYEKAQAANGGNAPSQDQIVAAFENLVFESPSGTVRMTLGKGHQAVQGTAYGTSKLVKAQLPTTDIKTYPAEKVNPPDGVKSEDWIKSGFKEK